MQEHFGPPSVVATATADTPDLLAAHADEHLGLGAMLRERAINLKAMPWPLRLLTLLVFVQLLAVGILTALRDQLAHLAMASTSATGVPLLIPQAIFFAILASLVLAWTCALTGALHSHGFVTLFVVWTFTLLVVSAQQPGVIGEIQAGLIAVIWLWAGVIWLLRRRATLRARPGVGRGLPSSRSSSCWRCSQPTTYCCTGRALLRLPTRFRRRCWCSCTSCCRYSSSPAPISPRSVNPPPGSLGG